MLHEEKVSLSLSITQSSSQLVLFFSTLITMVPACFVPTDLFSIKDVFQLVFFYSAKKASNYVFFACCVYIYIAEKCFNFKKKNTENKSWQKVGWASWTVPDQLLHSIPTNLLWESSTYILGTPHVEKGIFLKSNKQRGERKKATGCKLTLLSEGLSSNTVRVCQTLRLLLGNSEWFVLDNSWRYIEYIEWKREEIVQK